MADQAENPKNKKPLLYIGGFFLSFALTFGATYWYIVMYKHPPSASEVSMEQSGETFRDSVDTPHPSAVAAADSGAALDPLSQDSTADADQHRPLERTESREAKRDKGTRGQGDKEITPEEGGVVSPSPPLPVGSSGGAGKVGKLAKIYGAMRAERAAPIMARLNDTVVIEILVKMRERQAAKVLAAMAPDRAAQISRKMTVVQ